MDDADGFMSNLLDGLDESFFSSPTVPPTSQTHHLNRRQNPFAQGKRHLSTDSIANSHRSKSTKRTSCCGNSQCLSKAGCAKSPTKRTLATPSKDRSRSSAYDRELQAIDDLIRAEGDILFDELENFSPSPDRKRGSPKKKQSPRNPLAAVVNSSILPTVPRKHSPPREVDRYVRCVVDSVTHGTYIPDRYLRAPANHHTTKGVKPETVRRVMSRKEVTLNLTQVSRKGTEGQSFSSEDTRRVAILRDEWVYTPVQPGDIVHLIGVWSAVGSKAAPIHVEIGLEDEDDFFRESITSRQRPSEEQEEKTVLCMTLSSGDAKPMEAENLLVLHPDVLLSATAISTAVMTCARKPVLQAKVKASGPGPDDKPTEALVMGRMLHEVLQSCLTGLPKKIEAGSTEVQITYSAPSTFPSIWSGPDGTNFAESFVKEQITAQIVSSLDDLLLSGVDTHTASQRLWEATLPFGVFATTYLNCPKGTQAASPTPDITAEAIESRSAVAPLVRVVKVFDVEEDIWSPMYGLKGFVDVSVAVQVHERASEKEVKKSYEVMMPLELKTGRSINLVENRAQTMLYTLMMSDRYGRSVNDGLLYYSKSGEMHLVRSAPNEVRGLIVARNDLASYLAPDRLESASRESLEMTSRDLPPTIDNERTCSRCFVVDTCMLYRKAIDPIAEDETDQISNLSILHTSHLSTKHLAFFRHWDKLLRLEESDVVNYRREMWTMTASARERVGRCFADLAISKTPPPQQFTSSQGRGRTGMNSCIVYQFERKAGDDLGEGALLSGNFSVGDAICVSIEPSLLSIAQGFLLSMTPHTVVVGLDKNLESIVQRAQQGKEPTFRIDKEEQVVGMARTRYNLAKLFFSPPAGDARRRELIVDLRQPIFTSAEVGEQQKNEQAIFRDLNADQQGAIEKALQAEDYALIVGMPGTGKTTTIARLIMLLAKRGKSVLLASYTHSAVDTICRKLINEDGIGKDVRLLRLGNADRIHKDVQPFMLAQSETVEQLQARLLEPNVVATTCLSIGHALFGLRNKFDFCIVDEASQITLPTCLGPLRYAHKFVLVGDPQQLPPLVRNARARQGGLDVSLFERLQKAFPESIAYLCHQYRMNEDIMALSNSLIYDGRLQCGDPITGSAAVVLPHRDEALARMYTRQLEAWTAEEAHTPGLLTQEMFVADYWLTRALDANSRALFVNTDGLRAWEGRSGELVENKAEAQMAVDLALSLVTAGVASKEIAILTPYRQQIRRFNHLLAAQSTASDPSPPDLSGVELWTADKAQGRDKDVVIVSLVRSIPPNDDARSTADGGATFVDQHGVGQLLHDARRINVALTRARKKLIIIGSRQTLTRAPLLSKLWTLMQQKGWTIDAQEAKTSPSATSLPST